MMMGFGSLIWIVIIGGVIYLVMRGGGGGCCGGHDHGGHDHGGNGGHDQNAPMGHNSGMDHQAGHHGQIADGKDPVCGMSVKDNSITSEYQGHSYSFCSDHCREKFDANPADFIK